MQIDDQGDYVMPPVPMTDEQKFFFDLRGWILLPAVLTNKREIEEMKAEVNGGARQSYGPSLRACSTIRPSWASRRRSCRRSRARRMLRLSLRGLFYDGASAGVGHQ